MKFTLEVRTTISPTPYFFRRIHFMAASLRAIGGSVGNHEIVVSVGGGDKGDNYYRSQPWSNLYPLIWRSVPTEAYARLGYRATNRDRAAHMSRAAYVMLADADVMFIRDFPELLEELRRSPAICGVMAHVSPFLRPPTLSPAFTERLVNQNAPPRIYWDMLAEHFGIPCLALDHQYSGWGIMYEDSSHRFGPAYFNGGMVIGPANLMESMCALYAEAENSVDEVMDIYFRPQIARTLAICKANLPAHALPIRYNFPNDPLFDAAYPSELPNIAVMHYLRRQIVHRDSDFADPDAVSTFVARTDLVGSNEILRQRVAELLETVLHEESAGSA